MSVEVITTISPTTNEPVVTRNGISPADIALLPETAAKAFKTWRTTKLSDRQIIVRKALDALAGRTDELARELTEQMGRPIAYTGKEISTAIKRAEFLLKASDEALKDSPGEAEKGFERFIRKAPVGPVLVIFAWNVSLGPFAFLLSTVLPPFPFSFPRRAQCGLSMFQGRFPPCFVFFVILFVFLFFYKPDRRSSARLWLLFSFFVFPMWFLAILACHRLSFIAAHGNSHRLDWLDCHAVFLFFPLTLNAFLSSIIRYPQRRALTLSTHSLRASFASFHALR